MQPRSVIVAALLLCMFMAALEATVVATVMPTVVAELSGLALYGWVGAAFLLASTVMVPLYGKLADRSGRKPVLLVGMALFLAGSLASGLAGSIEQLIAFRALQGVGAGAVQPIIITIVGDLYRPEERGRIQALFGAVWAIAGVAGPLLGGLIVHTWSWRWAFLINLPPGLVAMGVLALVFREPRGQRTTARLDVAGALAITAASLALLLAASGVGPALMTTLGVALAASLPAIERRAQDPVLPLRLLTGRLVAVTSCASVLLGCAMMGTLTFLPLHVQGVLGRSPLAAGIVLAPMLVGWPLAASMSSRLLARIGYRRPVWLGAALTTLSLGVLAPLVTTRAPAWTLGAVMFVFGVGMGLANTVVMIGVQASVDWAQRGVATATLMFARSMGGALGVGALGALLALRLHHRSTDGLAGALLDPHRRADALAHTGVVDALGEALWPLFALGALAAAMTSVIFMAFPRDRDRAPAVRQSSA